LYRLEKTIKKMLIMQINPGAIILPTQEAETRRTAVQS
jgi:hypothetical protein